MKGLIIVNAYRIPNHCMKQAKRMKEEFDKLGVETLIVSDASSKFCIENGELTSKIKDVDFIVFWDKDKFLSKALTKLNIRLFNSHEAIRVCDDKGETCLALSNNGILMPKTFFAPLCYRKECDIDQSFAEHLIKELKFPIIVKETYGSMGIGVHKVENKAELLNVMEQLKLTPHVYQEYLDEKVGVDVRVIVIGKKAVASMERRNAEDFRSNIGQGGQGIKIELTEKFRKTAEKCASILGLDYCGVDLLYGKDGEPYVCEVNSNAFFEGIEKATNINVAKLYAEYIVSQIKK